MIKLSDYLDDKIKVSLMREGLTKQQAESKTAEVCAKVFMPEGAKVLLDEASRAVDRMYQELHKVENRYDELSDTILEIQKAQEEYGVLTDEKAKNALALYGSIMALNQKIHVDPNKSAESAGYILYAYLGGQAKRDITYVEGELK